jgi:hypothetical protein
MHTHIPSSRNPLVVLPKGCGCKGRVVLYEGAEAISLLDRSIGGL